MVDIAQIHLSATRILVTVMAGQQVDGVVVQRHVVVVIKQEVCGAKEVMEQLFQMDIVVVANHLIISQVATPILAVRPTMGKHVPGQILGVLQLVERLVHGMLKTMGHVIHSGLVR